MKPSELLKRISAALEALDIAYVVTGSTASIFYGEPRITIDIDIVADLRRDQVDQFCAQFPEGEFYCDRDMILDAIKRNGQFNILHPASGLKVDVFIATFSSYDRLRLSRANRLAGGADFLAWFASPEDVILKKLQYYQKGGSDKHVRDIAGVLKVQGDKIDRKYIQQWARELNVLNEWKIALERENKPGK